MLSDFYRQFTLKMSPFPTYLLGEVMCYRIKNLIGTHQKMFFTIFYDGVCDGYFSKSEFMRVGNIIVDKIEKNPNFIDNIKAKFEKYIIELISIAKEANKVGENTSNKKLNTLFQNYCKKYYKAYVYASIPFLADFSLEEKTKNIIAKKIVDKNKQQKDFLTFSYPTGASWNLKEELEGLKIYKTKSSVDLNKKINKHWNKWKWLEYDFEGKEINRKIFLEKIKKLNAKEIREIKERKKNINTELKNKQKLSKLLKLTDTEERLLRAVGELAYFKEYRKGLFSKTHYLIEPLLIAIARKGNLSLKKVRYLWPKEIEKMLLNNQSMTKMVSDRMNFSIYLQKGKQQDVLIKKKAKDFLEKNIKEDINKKISVIKGVVASMGKVSGTVKLVIIARDMKKMKKGNILVSTMTNPDLIPAISKAAAIVTDTGGMTCHAAIVSRELNIPCIIGTQHATKILKDGDLVEVDATKGVVKILKK